MVSIKQETVQLLTPDSTFRESIYAFYRKGIYYFLWSENDTRSEDYCVGTSASPTGPIAVPEDNLVLAKVPQKASMVLVTILYCKYPIPMIGVLFIIVSVFLMALIWVMLRDIIGRYVCKI